MKKGNNFDSPNPGDIGFFVLKIDFFVLKISKCTISRSYGARRWNVYGGERPESLRRMCMMIMSLRCMFTVIRTYGGVLEKVRAYAAELKS